MSFRTWSPGHRMAAPILLALACACSRPAPAPAPIPVPVPVPAPIPGPVPIPAAHLLLDAHNAERAHRGLPAYRWDERLGRAAQAHAEHMAARGILAHSGIGDGEPWDRMEQAGYRWSNAAENAAAGQDTEAEVMADWMGERPPFTGHRDNILGPCRDLGAGVATDGRGTKYWCVDFASPADEGP